MADRRAFAARERQFLVLERMAERVEFEIRDLVQIELQLQLCHVEEQLRLAEPHLAHLRNQFVNARYRSLKPSVPVRFHHPTPSRYSFERYARSRTAS